MTISTVIVTDFPRYQIMIKHYLFLNVRVSMKHSVRLYLINVIKSFTV